MTADQYPESHGFEIAPGRRIRGVVDSVLIAPGDHFETREAASLTLGWDGIEGDFHAGLTRKSGGREPWYPRGTQMRNERQITLVAPDELALVAQRMGIAQVKPEWLGANIVLTGVPHLSMLPRGTLIFFEGGVTLKLDDQNGPCRIAGKVVARGAGMADIEAGSLLFPKAAKRLRGILAWVEIPGVIKPGERVNLKLPEQWIWQG